LKKSELLKGWEETPLSEIAEINPAKPEKDSISENLEVSFVPMKCVEELTGKINLSNTRKYKQVRKGYTYFQDDDIIFAKITPCMENGKIAIAKELTNRIGFGSTEFHVVRLKDDDLSRKFYFWYLMQNDFRNKAQRKMKGTAGQLRVSPDYMKSVIVPVPPLNEQKRIISKIEELFSKIDSTITALDEIKFRLEQYKPSFLRWVFYGDFKQKFSFSSDWKKLCVKDVFNIIGGGTPSTKNPKYWNGKTPWITSADIYGIKDIRPRRNVSQKGIENSATHLIPNNSILVVTRVGLGKLAITEEPMCINQDIQALIERDSNVFSLFALHYLSEEVQIFKYRNRGTTISGVTKKQLADLPFILPSIDEQKRIVDYIELQISKLKNTEKTVEKNLSILSSMKNSILKRAFEGKLVPQNPNDEPASELLKRIKLVN